jgi:hypothetical protein
MQSVISSPLSPALHLFMVGPCQDPDRACPAFGCCVALLPSLPCVFTVATEELRDLKPCSLTFLRISFFIYKMELSGFLILAVRRMGKSNKCELLASWTSSCPAAVTTVTIIMYYLLQRIPDHLRVGTLFVSGGSQL